MFKHRLSKFGKATLFVACMLLVGGSLNSCQDMLDDYKYDDDEPNWLGASVYDFLKEGTPGHTYNNFVELIDSLGEKETLAHTGSKTLFVADDAAFERFFADNPWGVKSISEMSKAQMKILLYNSMLDNAMLLDMLSSTGSGTSSEGTCLRRLTSASIIDSIPLVKGEDMPTYNKYWDALRGKTRDAELRIAMDGTQSMMVHFLGDYLKNNAIKDTDIEFLFKKNGDQTKTFKGDEALVFGNKIVANGVPTDGFSDDTLTITCKNGYIYRLDEVLLPPSNMAEELRRRDDTKVFSHLLDRFCIPVYDPSLTAEYQGHYNTEDSIFRLRYFSKGSFENYNLLEAANANPTVDELLNYDPGWNEFANSLSKERDMAAMFVPKDEYLYDYFADGAGKFLVEQFAKNVEIKDIPSLIQALDSVPEVNIAPFLNNLMKSSFVGTVPSKFEKVTDDANDEMGITEKDVDECVIANNGVIYLLNNVFGPATYQAVSAPTIVFDNMLLMRNIIKQLRYDYYLLAMDAEYSFIIPDDSTFVYYDPLTTSTNTPTAYAFHYNDKRPKGNKRVELWADKYKFNPATYEITDTLTPLSGISVTGTNFGGNTFMKNRMTDLMEYLIVVHNDGEGITRDDGTLNPRKYYQTKGYGTIKVDTSDPNQIKFYGGEQIENGTAITAQAIYEQKNGYTYCTVPVGENAPGQLLSGVPTPPTKSVLTNMQANGEEEDAMYHEFYQLCTPADLQGVLKTMFPKVSEAKIKSDSLKVYSIFFSSTDGKEVGLVPFFNTYHYTVYIPSNESVRALIDEKGLPTWEQITDLAADQPLKAAAAMRLLNNFLRYHFQDNSVYVDAVPFSLPSPEGGYYTEANFATSVIDAKTGRFYEINVKSDANNSTLLITDQQGNVARVVNDVKEDEGKTWNVMSRDIKLTAKTNGHIATSSFAVIQPVDRALLNDGLFGYDGRFRRYATTGELVNVMAVDGASGSVQLEDGSKPYLVADFGYVTMLDKNGVETRMRLAYLMKPLDAADPAYDALTRETLVLDAEGNKILITAEGFMVTEKKDADGVKTYDYVTEPATEEGYEYMLKVDNNGNVIDRVLREKAVEAE